MYISNLCCFKQIDKPTKNKLFMFLSFFLFHFFSFYLNFLPNFPIFQGGGGQGHPLASIWLRPWMWVEGNVDKNSISRQKHTWTILGIKNPIQGWDTDILGVTKNEYNYNILPTWCHIDILTAIRTFNKHLVPKVPYFHLLESHSLSHLYNVGLPASYIFHHSIVQSILVQKSCQSL